MATKDGSKKTIASPLSEMQRAIDGQLVPKMMEEMNRPIPVVIKALMEGKIPDLETTRLAWRQYNAMKNAGKRVGRPKSADPTVAVNVSLPGPAYRMSKRVAEALGHDSFSAFVADAVTYYLQVIIDQKVALAGSDKLIGEILGDKKEK